MRCLIDANRALILEIEEFIETLSGIKIFVCADGENVMSPLCLVVDPFAKNYDLYQCDLRKIPEVKCRTKDLTQVEAPLEFRWYT